MIGDCDLARNRARARRFEAEARNPPPPLPKNRMAHPGGKIVTNDKAEVMRAFLARKAAAGAPMTVDQQRALQSLDGSSANIPCSNPCATRAVRKVPLTQAVDGSKANSAPKITRTAPCVVSRSGDTASNAPSACDTADKRLRAVRKKLREIEILEQRNHATLEQNQRAKIASKPSLLAELASIGA